MRLLFILDFACSVYQIEVLATQAISKSSALIVAAHAEFIISSHPQVILWTAVMLAAILIGTIYFMLGMDTSKDPQLYAQIADPRQKSGASR